jgi:nucleotide-binding universal stress UspA family protein
VAMVFTRIAAPTDGTEASLRGLQVAMQMAAGYGAELLVLTVVSMPDWLARQKVEQGSMEAYVESVAQKSLQAALDLLRREGVGAEVKVVVGPAPESILAEVNASGADLVIMGRRSRDEPKDLVLGSVSDRVARHVKVPILLVP